MWHRCFEGGRTLCSAYLGCVCKDVCNGVHGGLRGENVGVAHHELLQDVILNGPRQLVFRHALLLPSHNEHGQHGDHCTIHRHGDGHPLQRDAVKEHLHVLHCVYGDACHAHIAVHAWVVWVIAAVCWEVKGHGETLLPGWNEQWRGLQCVNL